MTFQEFITKVGQTFNGNPLTMALTIAFLFVLFYFAISILNHNNAKWVIVVFVAYILCTGTMFMLAEISGWNYFIVPLLFIVAIVAMFYFIGVRPSQQERKKQQELLASVAVGDTVLTSSGFYGVIIDMTDDTVIVEFGNNKNCRIPMQRNAITNIEKPEA
jgi:preprotein translocase subunit YajC